MIERSEDFDQIMHSGHCQERIPLAISRVPLWNGARRRSTSRAPDLFSAREEFPHLAGFEILGPLRQAQTIATSGRIRELSRLLDQYGQGRWRKRKGVAAVRLSDGTVREAEVHWYEAAGIGRKEFKIKRYLDLQ